MTEGRTDQKEDAAAVELLRRYGGRVAGRGRPYFLKLRWRSGDDRLEVAVVSRAEGLLGVTVGLDWEAAAVVATGRFHCLDDSNEPPAHLRQGMGGGLTMACVVSRRDTVGWRLLLPDGSRFDPPPEEGFMLDVLRRSLQLPTPAPAVSTGPLLLTVWAAAICATGEGLGDRLDWDCALRLHPALIDGPPLPTPEAEHAVRRAVDQARWESMRLLVAAGTSSPDLPRPALARWMDDGMFSRWVLRSLPPAAQIVGAAQPHLDPGAWRRLHHLAREVDDRTGVT